MCWSGDVWGCVGAWICSPAGLEPSRKAEASLSHPRGLGLWFPQWPPLDCSHCRLDRTWERACQLCKWWCCSMWPARGKRRGLGGALERVGIQLSGQVLGVSLTSCPEFTRPSCPLPHPALPWLPIQCWRSG